MWHTATCATSWILAIALFSTAAAQEADLTAGLVGHWKLDRAERGIVDDSTQHAHSGKVQGAPKQVAGKLGQALAFHGPQDGIQLANPRHLNFAGKITLAAWVRPGDRKQDYRNIVSHGLGPRETMLRIAQGGYQVGTWDGKMHYATSKIPAGDLDQWVHLAGTYDGAAWKLYRNGRLIQTTQDPVGAVEVEGDWTIGCHQKGFDRCFGGDIDDVRIYQRALSADEVLQLTTAREAEAPPAALASERSPPPAPAAQLEADKLVRELFEKELAAAKKAPEKSALAAKMLEQVNASQDDAAAKFALLKAGLELAVAAGDPELTLKIVDRRSSHFELDARRERVVAIQRLDKSVLTPAARQALATLTPAVLEESVAADDFDAALQLVRIAQEAARDAKNVKLAKLLVDRGKEVSALQQEFALASQATEKLASDPSDAAANTTVGKWLLRKQDPAAMKHLAQGSDPSWKAAATKELEAPQEVAAQAALADAWWELGEGVSNESAKHVVLRHAAGWYAKALPNLSGLSKAKAEKRMSAWQAALAQTVTAQIVEAEPAAAARTAPKTTATTPAKTGRIVKGRPVGTGKFFFNTDGEATPYINGVPVQVRKDSYLGQTAEVTLSEGDVVVFHLVNKGWNYFTTAFVSADQKSTIPLKQPEDWADVTGQDPRGLNAAAVEAIQDRPGTNKGNERWKNLQLPPSLETDRKFLWRFENGVKAERCTFAFVVRKEKLVKIEP